ncbi:MAG: hypothetical protein NZM35_06590 [Chitinophagales bacterium]|nr:hypothetical protein [Chitinophagales bacterium]MDW8419970.1 hypothetical protein [Chitinophagales bacterium]
MNYSEQHLLVQRTARYYTTGEITSHTREVWFVLHGYAQLASDFIRLFQFAASPYRVIIAPEALQRFYVKGSAGSVGATWMTKEDRTSDIADNLFYLDALYHSCLQNSPVKYVTVLGFSQGAATASRWVHHAGSTIHRLILYAGEIAHELIPLPAGSALLRTENHFLIGRDDKYFASETADEIIKRYTAHNISVDVFDGGHNIVPQALKKFL